jgi:pyrroline-5-carboxylate reductase
MNCKLGFIGAGNMAEAIARGVLSSGLHKPQEMIAADISPQRRGLFADELKIRSIEDAVSVVTQSEVVLFCTKPQQMAEALASIKDVVTEGQLFVSIAAGISTRFIEQTLNPSRKLHVVRAMPNTPMLVGRGMVAIAPGTHASSADLAKTRKVFQSAASVVELKEELIDAVTAVSGSGPAYIFFLVEQMVQAGIEMGLTPEDAHQLATQTALGSAEMLVKSKDSPAELRRKVTSPNGTTHAAITHMQQHNLPQIVIDALKAACSRSKELGK